MTTDSTNTTSIEPAVTQRARVFKTVRSSELEQYTRSGWKLESVHTETGVVWETHSVGVVNIYGGPQPSPPTARTVGDVLIFVISQDMEIVTEVSNLKLRVDMLNAEIMKLETSENRQAIEREREERNRRITNNEGRINRLEAEVASANAFLDRAVQERLQVAASRDEFALKVAVMEARLAAVGVDKDADLTKEIRVNAVVQPQEGDTVQVCTSVVCNGQMRWRSEPQTIAAQRPSDVAAALEESQTEALAYVRAIWGEVRK